MLGKSYHLRVLCFFFSWDIFMCIFFKNILLSVYFMFSFISYIVEIFLDSNFSQKHNIYIFIRNVTYKYSKLFQIFLHNIFLNFMSLFYFFFLFKLSTKKEIHNNFTHLIIFFYHFICINIYLILIIYINISL